MKRSGKTFALALLLLLACLLVAPPEAAAQRIAVFPFDIYSERDATLLRNAIYNSMTLELGKIRTIQIVPREQFAPLVSGKTADEALALSVGKQIRADYVIVGSLTQLGNRVSLDAKAVTVETGAVITGLFAQGAGIENTGAFATQLARDILARVSGKQVIARIDLTGNRRIESTVIYNVLKGAKGKTLLRGGPLVRHPGHLPDGLLHGREGRCHGQRRRQGDHLHPGGASLRQRNPDQGKRCRQGRRHPRGPLLQNQAGLQPRPHQGRHGQDQGALRRQGLLQRRDLLHDRESQGTGRQRHHRHQGKRPALREDASNSRATGPSRTRS